MTVQNDPWATPSAATQAATENASADPFATPDEVGGTSGPRGPKWAEILNRLVVLKPIEKLLDQPVKDDTAGKTQNIYVCDLTVLGADPVEVYTPAREADGKSYPESTESFAAPFTWNRWYAYGKGVEVKLDGVAKSLDKDFLLGVVRRCPTGAGYRKGETPNDIDKRWNEYRAALQAGRDTKKPMFSWGIVDPTAEDRQIALAWWRGQ